LLGDAQMAASLPELFNADVSFETREKLCLQPRDTDLFCTKTREIAIARSRAILDQRNGMSVPGGRRCAQTAPIW